MKHVLRVTLALACLWVTPARADEPCRMAYIEAYPPLSWMQAGRPTGVTVTILTEALQHRMGLDVVHSLNPWKRAQERVRAGGEDALITQPTPVRREYGLIGAERIMSIHYTLFASRENPRFDAPQAVRDIGDLQPFVPGQLRGRQRAERRRARCGGGGPGTHGECPPDTRLASTAEARWLT